jgi:transcriptional regulator with PAS, ATPase and Fis domain
MRGEGGGMDRDHGMKDRGGGPPGTDGVSGCGQPSSDALVRIGENMVQNCAVAFFVIDASHRVIHWNRACEGLTGIKASDVMGTSDHWKAFYDHRRSTLSDLIIDGDLEHMDDLYAVHGPSLLIPNGLHAEGWYPNVGGRRRYLIFDASPILQEDGGLLGVVETLQDITVLKEMEEEKERLNVKLKEALNEIKTLSGLIPICAACKKIRDDKGYWNQLENYLEAHSAAVFSHGLCPECFQEYFPEAAKPRKE